MVNREQINDQFTVLVFQHKIFFTTFIVILGKGLATGKKMKGRVVAGRDPPLPGRIRSHEPMSWVDGCRFSWGARTQ